MRLSQDKKEVNRTQDHIDPWAEEEVNLADVIRSTRHQIPYRLQRMEGHTFAKQGDIETRLSHPFLCAGLRTSKPKFRQN